MSDQELAGATERPYKQNLWWLDYAWSKDSIEWLTLGAAPSGVRGDSIDLREEFFEEEFFENVVPFFPEAQPSVDQLVDYYIQRGDPYRAPQSFKLVDRFETSQFVYDEASKMGRPTQLLSYYLNNYSNEPTATPGSSWRDNIAIRHRVEMLTKLIPFTQEEWDWFVGSGCTDPTNSLYAEVLTNPAITTLKVVAGSEEPLLDRLFQVGKTYAEEYLKAQVSRAEKEARGERRSRTDSSSALADVKEKLYLSGRGLAMHPVNHWLRTPFATAEHIQEFARIYSAVGEAIAEIEERKKSRSLRPQFREIYLLWQVLDGIQTHPAYDGDLSALMAKIAGFWPEGGEGEPFEGRLTFDLLNEAEGYDTAEVKKFIIHQEGLEHHEPSDPKVLGQVFHAYSRFTPDDALEVFTALLGSEDRTEIQDALIVMLLPLLSIGFVKVREDYDDLDGNLPLEWLLQASGL